MNPRDEHDLRARLEREAMAWPPSEWERTPGVWRDDLLGAPDAFEPFSGDQALPSTSTRPRVGAAAREMFETVVLTAIIFISIRFVVQNFRIEGRSMEPTLHSGQYLLVNKLSYGRYGEPQRGDIVVFQAWNQDKDFIKRVIAVPGDEVSIHDNHVYVNGNPLDEPYVLDSPHDTIGPIHLAEGDLYVLGDNRGNSSDSRAFGPLDEDQIIGKAWLTYWPPGQVGLIPDSKTSFASSSGR